jgi:hypothetical protein
MSPQVDYDGLAPSELPPETYPDGSPVELPTVPDGILLPDGTEIQPVDSSLEERMARRRAELESDKPFIAPVPRWGDMFAVELGHQDYRQGRRLAEAHRRNRDIVAAELYMSCDQMLAATQGFHEVKADGSYEKVTGDMSWIRLQQAALPKLGKGLTSRQALLALCGDRAVMNLYGEWQMWMNGERPAIDAEMSEDFGTTP